MNYINTKVVMLKGEAGSNISNIEKSATDGLIDTYTVTLTDGSKYSFNVTNGKDANILNAFPIGSVYMNVTSISPDTLIGGTWEALNNGNTVAINDNISVYIWKRIS